MTFGGLEKLTLIDYPGAVACMVYTIGCNFRCPYCHNPELVDETVETRISEKDFFDFLDARKRMLEGVVITGGEPTMHADLPDFMKKVRGRGFLVKLDTNGTNPSMLERAIQEDLVNYVAMDIKAPLHSYSQTVARPVDVQAIRQSIDILRSSPVDYEFRTTVIKSLLSPQDIEDIGKEIQGAKRHYLQKFIPTKILNPQFRKKTTYDDEEFAALQEKMNHYVEYCGIR
jgi:pyruvate formate lyase activating enzyme